VGAAVQYLQWFLITEYLFSGNFAASCCEREGNSRNQHLNALHNNDLKQKKPYSTYRKAVPLPVAVSWSVNVAKMNVM
jgi:hypothetical protein